RALLTGIRRRSGVGLIPRPCPKQRTTEIKCVKSTPSLVVDRQIVSEVPVIIKEEHIVGVDFGEQGLQTRDRRIQIRQRRRGEECRCYGGVGNAGSSAGSETLILQLYDATRRGRQTHKLS